MDVRLVMEQGRRRTVFALRPPGGIVGRQKGSAIRIPSAEVSRQHCWLRLEDGLVTVEDLDSVNGTFLNGERVQGVEYVRPGDRLEVGPVTFVVEYVLTPKALARLFEDEDQGAEEVIPEVLAVDEADEADVPVFEVSAALGEETEDLEIEILPAAEEDEAIQPDFSFEGAWDMPQADDLRDLLSQMEQDGEPPPGQGNKKR